MAETASDSTKLVADIDCTAAGEPLCNEHGVQGFPTLKWGDVSDLQDYEGGRDYDTLKAFVDNLKPMCNVKNIDLCEGEKKAQIEKYMGMSLDELKAAAEKEEMYLAGAESQFEKEVEKLQAAYEKLEAEKQKKIDEVKNAGLGLMKSVIKNKMETVKDEL